MFGLLLFVLGLFILSVGIFTICWLKNESYLRKNNEYIREHEDED